MTSTRNKLIVLAIVAYSLLVSCKSTSVNNRVWPNPIPPITKEVVFTPFNTANGRGVFITDKHTINLASNISEQKRYIADLENLVESMKEYYKAK